MVVAMKEEFQTPIDGNSHIANVAELIPVATPTTEPRRPIKAPQFRAIGPSTIAVIVSRNDCNNQTCEIVEFSHNARRIPSGNAARHSHVQHDSPNPLAIKLRCRLSSDSHRPIAIPAMSTDNSNVINANESGMSCRQSRWPITHRIPAEINATTWGTFPTCPFKITVGEESTLETCLTLRDQLTIAVKKTINPQMEETNPQPCGLMNVAKPTPPTTADAANEIPNDVSRPDELSPRAQSSGTPNAARATNVKQTHCQTAEVEKSNPEASISLHAIPMRLGNTTSHAESANSRVA